MIVQKITQKYGHAKIDCCDERCKLYVDTGKNLVILKGELLVSTSHKKMCDCIIFQDDNKIALVELKSSSIDVNKIIDKFTNSGNKSIEMLTPSQSNNSSLFMILLAKKYTSFSAHDRLRRSTIKIHGKKYPIFTKKCGESLKNIF